MAEHLHTLTVLVENKPGVLTRVAGLFARRAFNIKSLTVGETEKSGISRMTIIVDAQDQPLEQVIKQLNKLVNVLKVVELPEDESVERRMLLLKVRADDETRTAVCRSLTCSALTSSTLPPRPSSLSPWARAASWKRCWRALSPTA